jgi:DNA-binding transcriptional regulator YdaS (Cro superfamily)
MQGKRNKNMQLRQYLEKHGIRNNFFADKIGVKSPQICRWLSGKSLPGLEYAIKIEDETNGAVTCRDWLVNDK